MIVPVSPYFVTARYPAALFIESIASRGMLSIKCSAM
nr:MAG TPA: hypothetical protein [Caudoviricetes sp.]